MIHTMDLSFDPNLAAESAAPVRIAVTVHHGKRLIKPDIHWRAEKSATIQKIANNPLLAATEIRLLRKRLGVSIVRLLEQFCRMN
jgi:hypothetical protein